MYEKGELPDLANNPDSCQGVGRVRLALVSEPREEIELRPLPCTRASTAAELIRPIVAGEPQEVVGALLLDTRNRPVGYTLPYRGTLSRATVEARGVFVPALLMNASSIILFHNHPTGDPSPSHDDREMTRQFVRAGEILGVRVLDHLVLGEERSYVSLREQGIWDTLERPA